MQSHPQGTPLEGVWWLSTAVLLLTLLKMKTSRTPTLCRPASGTLVVHPPGPRPVTVPLLHPVVLPKLVAAVGVVAAVVVVAVSAVEMPNVSG